MDRLKHRRSRLEMLRRLFPPHGQLGQLFQPLDRVTVAAPIVLRHSRQKLVPWPVIGRAHLAIQRINRDPAIRSQRPKQTGIAALSITTRHPRQSDDQITL